MLVSLIIATYRRPAMLRDTVMSLQSMRAPSGVEMEVLIIDNDPEGGARSAATELAAACRGTFVLRYVHETKTGLSHARNRGIAESRGEVLAFLDDDLFVGEQWLASVLRCFDQHPADCVGGRTLVHWEGEPDPVLKACAGRIVSLDQGEGEFEVRGRKLPGGGNAAFRRAVFDRGLRFATDLGRVGNVLLSGEDTELMLRMRRAGGRIWYCGAASVRHRTGGERLRREYVVKQKHWFGISFAVIDRKVHGPARQWCVAVARLVKLLCVALPQLAAARLRGNGPAELVARCALAKQLGYLRATVAPLPTVVAPPAASWKRPSVATP